MLNFEQKELIREQIKKHNVTDKIGFVRWMIRVFNANKE